VGIEGIVVKPNGLAGGSAGAAAVQIRLVPGSLSFSIGREDAPAMGIPFSFQVKRSGKPGITAASHLTEGFSYRQTSGAPTP
jgi:hypothetical protein